MEVNFKIYNNHAIRCGDSIFDLHNNFAFTGFDYNIADQRLVLRWKKRQGDWVPADEASDIHLVVEGLDFLQIYPRDPETPFSEDDCLMDWTYNPSNYRSSEWYRECVGPSELPDKDDDVVFKFESGLVICAKGKRFTAEIVR